jgi:hypothetical protein
MLYVSTALFMYDVSDAAGVCCMQNFQQIPQQTDRHTPKLHIVCVCDTALLRLDTLVTVNYTLYFSVPRENISPFISQLPASHTNS